jgi:hypothetical protein
VYNIDRKTTENLTLTNEREYSPTVTPDQQFISCIIQRDNGAQDLGKYPVNGGTPLILINDRKVGYHSWISEHELLLFVLADINTLQLYDLRNSSMQTIATNIGRSLHRIPGEQAMSFIQKNTDSIFQVQRFDINTKQVTTIGRTFPNKEDIAWLSNQVYLMSDGRTLFFFDLKTKAWSPVFNDKPVELKGVTRLAVNNSNTKLAIVVAETQDNLP